MNDIGKHLFADLYEIDPALLGNEQALMDLLRSALVEARFTILDQVSYTFPGGGAGVTGMYLLSESHAAFHTYPEIPYMALDIFSCGASDPQQVLDQIIQVLQPGRVHTTVARRGENYRSALSALPIQPAYH